MKADGVGLEGDGLRLGHTPALARQANTDRLCKSKDLFNPGKSTLRGNNEFLVASAMPSVNFRSSWSCSHPEQSESMLWHLQLPNKARMFVIGRGLTQAAGTTGGGMTRQEVSPLSSGKAMLVVVLECSWGSRDNSLSTRLRHLDSKLAAAWAVISMPAVSLIMVVTGNGRRWVNSRAAAVLPNFTTSDEKGNGFRGVWIRPQGEGAKERLLVFDVVAALHKPKAWGALMDILQAISMLFQSHVRLLQLAEKTDWLPHWRRGWDKEKLWAVMTAPLLQASFAWAWAFIVYHVLELCMFKSVHDTPTWRLRWVVKGKWLLGT
jgi:hypothetical protein